MKETNLVSSSSYRDSIIRLTLMHIELRKEIEAKRRKLEMIKQKQSTLKAEVRFLRRRYKDLKQDQTLETSSEMLRLSEPEGLEIPSKPNGENKNHSGVKASMQCSNVKQKNVMCKEKESLPNNASCDLEKKLKRSRENEVLTCSIPLPDLNGDENNAVNNNVSVFDLNQISREELEPEANGEHMVVEATKNAIQIHGAMKLPIYGDLEKGISRAVKRKVSWQDPVALRV